MAWIVALAPLVWLLLLAAGASLLGFAFQEMQRREIQRA
jgi:hypothetical protein